MTEDPETRKEWTLEPETELRIEVARDSTFIVQLRSGNAEIFGTELGLNQIYRFKNSKIAIFTWFGCLIETQGKATIAYLSNETPMISYVNTHAQLEARRDAALSTSTAGPRVLISGPVDSGKSTLSKILTAYAVRLGRHPIFVDLDIGQGEITIPGCIAAVPLDSNTYSIEDEFSYANPLTFFFGHASISESPALYRHYIDQMGHHINERLKNDVDANASGIIVNSCGFIEDLGFDLLCHCISSLAIDVVLVLGHDRLYAELRSTISDSVTIVKLPRSGGVIQRTTKARKKVRMQRIQEYFYGLELPDAIRFSPTLLHIPFHKLQIFKIGGLKLTQGLLPIGQLTNSTDPLQLINVIPSQVVLHSILAVLHPLTFIDDSSNETTEEIYPEKIQSILKANVAGYLYVQQIDTEKEIYQVLAPCPGSLPSSYAMMGSITWMENLGHS